MMINQTVDDILQEFAAEKIIFSSRGDRTLRITGIAPVERSGPGDIVFADKPAYAAEIKTRRPSAVVTTSALEPLFDGCEGLAVLVAPNVALAHARIKTRWASRDFSRSGWEPDVHASAVVHQEASLGEGVVVEPNAVIGKGARIGARTRVMAGAVIESEATIGSDCVIFPTAVIGYKCEIGDECSVGSGSVIGSEGYGFAQDAHRRSHAIPQTGIVVLENRVRIGAGCCVDRATYRETRIGAGTKLDNLCHVAHNVRIGEDCLLTAFFCVAGSTQIGDRVIASGQTAVLDHLSICSDVVLLQRAGVSRDIDKPGAYAGGPLLPLADFLKREAVLKTLVDMRRRLGELERTVARLGAAEP